MPPATTFRISFSTSTSASFSLPPSLLLSTSSFLHHFRYSALIRGPHELVLPTLGRRIARCGFSRAIDLVPIFFFLYALRLRQFLVRLLRHKPGVFNLDLFA
jgi:hypothetical protein